MICSAGKFHTVDILFQINPIFGCLSVGVILVKIGP